MKLSSKVVVDDPEILSRLKGLPEACVLSLVPLAGGRHAIVASRDAETVCSWIYADPILAMAMLAIWVRHGLDYPILWSVHINREWDFARVIIGDPEDPSGEETVWL